MTIAPQRTRTYQNHHLDSTRWDGFVHRPGDIVIATSYKTGTTWMQRIVSLLIFGPGPLPEGTNLMQLSPWIDQRFFGTDRAGSRTTRDPGAPPLPEESSPVRRDPVLGGRQLHLRRTRHARRIHVGVQPHTPRTPTSRTSCSPGTIRSVDRCPAARRTLASSGRNGSRHRTSHGRATVRPCGLTTTKSSRSGSTATCRMR